MKRKIELNFIAVLIMCMLISTGCYQRREYAYYSDESNFVSVTAELNFLNFDKKNGVLYLGFGGLPNDFSDDAFKIVGKNLEIIEEKGGEHCFAIGDKITFITAPRYFGDGYVMPIVALSKDGNTLLDYEEGYKNFMAFYN